MHSPSPVAATPTRWQVTWKNSRRASGPGACSPDRWRRRWRVQQAHSLRELWHLRSDVYNTVALAHSQGEAEARLLLINQHFPTRAPRSQFAPL